MVPDGINDASFSIVACSNSGSGSSISLLKNGVAVSGSTTISSKKVTVLNYTDLSTGTYTLKDSSSSFSWGLLLLKTPAVYSISGTVKDSKGNAIENARLTVNGEYKISTDSSGNFYFDVPDVVSDYDISVTALGYQSEEKTVKVNKKDVNESFILYKNRKNIHKFYCDERIATDNDESINNNNADVFTDAAVVTGTKWGTENILDVGGSSYKVNYCGSACSTITIVVPEGVTDADLYMVLSGKNSFALSAKTMNLTLSKNGTAVDTSKQLTINGVNVINYTGLSEGTYTLASYYSGRLLTLYQMLFVMTTSDIYEIEGKVTDTTGIPIKCATVYIDDKEKITDSNGNYSIDIDKDTKVNNIKVTAMGYEDLDESVSINCGTTHNITLNKKSVVYKFFSNSNDAINNYDSLDNNNTEVFQNAGTNTDSLSSAGADYKICGSTYRLAGAVKKGTGFSIIVPKGIESADFYMVAGSGEWNRPKRLSLVKNGTVVDYEQSLDDEEYKIVKYTGLSEGEYTLTADCAGISSNFSYCFMALVSSELPITEKNITDCVIAIDNGMVKNIEEDSPFADSVANLNGTDKVFTIVGMVNGNYKDDEFMNQVDKVGFVLYDADVVDSLGENAKTMNPILLKRNYSDIDFREETIKTDTVYKNFYDVEQYDSALDSETDYTGAKSLEESEDKSYFAYVVALGKGNRYYAYPYTLYNGGNQNIFDAKSDDKIEISNN